MAIKPILVVPDPRLYQKCQKVKEVDSQVKQDVQDILDTLRAAKNPEGAGLAAPQIGILKRIIVVRRWLPDPANPEGQIIKEYVLINPKIVTESEEISLNWEACLSVPHKYGKVRRHTKIKVAALDENGTEIRLKATGFFARVIQHEIDHLEGEIFTDKVVGELISEKELDEIHEGVE